MFGLGGLFPHSGRGEQTYQEISLGWGDTDPSPGALITLMGQNLFFLSFCLPVFLPPGDKECYILPHYPLYSEGEEHLFLFTLVY